MEEKKKNEWESAEKLVTELVSDVRAQAKRWFVAFIAMLIALIGTNAYWIYVFNSYEYVYQDGSGENYYNNEVDGDVENGTNNQEEEER